MLNLVRRTATSPASPDELSPARQALIDNIEECAVASQRAVDLGAAERAASEAVGREAEAQAALDTIVEREAVALRLWSNNPIGPLPAPLTSERERAFADLANLRAATVIAQRNSNGVADAVSAAHEALGKLVAKRPELLKAVVFEEAQALRDKYFGAIREAQNLEGLLVGIADSFRGKGDGWEKVQKMIAGTVGDRERIKASIDRHRRVGSQLAARIATDPTATIEAEDE